MLDNTIRSKKLTRAYFKYKNKDIGQREKRKVKNELKKDSINEKKRKERKKEKSKTKGE